MLVTVEAFLFDGGQQLPVANDGGRRVAVISVNAQNDHLLPLLKKSVSA
jgi:hypothetical protein